MRDRNPDACRNCGRKGWLDEVGGCCARCTRQIEDDFVASGHNHGPCDPPEDCRLCISMQTFITPET